jgi:phenylacetate-CoA ligase
MYKSNKLLHSLYLSAPGFVKNGMAGIYSRLVARKKYGKYFVYWSELLKESQYYPADRLRQLQAEWMRDFLISALETSPWYRHLANEKGFDPDRLQNPVDVRAFPVLPKATLRTHYDEILSLADKKYKFSSSGTTGTSLHVYLDDEAYQREYAFRWHYLNMGGATRKDRFAYFLGNNLYPVNKQNPPFHIIDHFEHSIYFSLFHMSDSNLSHYVEAFNRFQPSFIKGYPSGIYVFARFIQDRKMVVHKLKAIYSASETLHEYQKKLFEEVFQCPVYQWYGQVETTVNIHECEHHRFHVKEEYGFLELLNEKGEDAKPGEIASAIGTGWGNKALPLIRYDTGDNMILAAEQTCPCGRNGRIIEKILGRDEDFIITPDGRKIGRLDFIFKPVDTVSESQIVQESMDRLVIKIVPQEGFSSRDEQTIRKMISTYIGNAMQVDIIQVNSIERSASGKIRYVISKVKQP